MLTSAEILRLVNDFIHSLPYERQPYSLYEPVVYTLESGGKRIRPVLMLLAYNLFKEDPESILMTAAGLETYHNYTLLHDDLMDNSDTRRGRQTVHRKWDANTAILSGDSMLVLAYERVAQCNDTKLREVLSCFTETALQIGEGQQYDMDFEQRDDVREEEYIEMIRLKTSVLLACALKIGAILAGASAEDQDALYRLGECVGLAFQLQDDYLDVYGDKEKFGKPIGGDICNNKKTFMLINALQCSKGAQHEELSRWISTEQCDQHAKVAAVTQIYNDLGIDTLAVEKINSYFNQASQYLNAISVSEDRKQVLRDYIAQMVQRDY